MTPSQYGDSPSIDKKDSPSNPRPASKTPRNPDPHRGNRPGKTPSPQSSHQAPRRDPHTGTFHRSPQQPDASLTATASFPNTSLPPARHTSHPTRLPPKDGFHSRLMRHCLLRRAVDPSPLRRTATLSPETRPRCPCGRARADGDRFHRRSSDLGLLTTCRSSTRQQGVPTTKPLGTE